MSSMFTSLTHSDTPGGRLTFALLTCAYVGLITAGSSACGNTTHVAPEVLDAGEGPDATDDCARAAAELQAFLAQHRSCKSDADCTTVGDCGPYIVHEPVNLAGADQARALQLKTCQRGYDGETTGPRVSTGSAYASPVPAFAVVAQSWNPSSKLTITFDSRGRARLQQSFVQPL